MAEDKRLTELVYVPMEDYDSSVKVNGEEIRVYSPGKIKKDSSESDFTVLGQTWEKKKHNERTDIGRVELGKQWLFVAEGEKNKGIFRKEVGYFRIKGGSYVSLLKRSILPFILIAVLALALIGGGIYWAFNRKTPGIKQADKVLINVSGNVYDAGSPVEGAVLSLQKGNEEVKTTKSDKDGRYLFSEVDKGNYNLVCSYGDSVLTKLASVSGESLVIDFYFPTDNLKDVSEITGITDSNLIPVIAPDTGKTRVKAQVKIQNKNTPAIAVGGLDTEALLDTIVDNEVDLTFSATQLKEEEVPAQDLADIKAISGEVELSWFNFGIQKTVLKDQTQQSSEDLTTTKTIQTIVVPFDSSKAVGTYVFRDVNGNAQRFTELEEKPEGNYTDGTFYVTREEVFIYCNQYCTFAVGAANDENRSKGKDVVTFSDKAVVSKSTGKIALLYEHDKNSTHDAKVEVYLKDDSNEQLIAVSDTIPPGYRLESLTAQSTSALPSAGTYNGVMRISYLDTESDKLANQMDFALTITIEN